MTSTYKVGDDIEGKVTGIVDFRRLRENRGGSGRTWSIFPKSTGALSKIRNSSSKSATKCKVKIIDVKDGKISLSLKALKQNPWKEAAAKYKKDIAVAWHHYQIQQTRRARFDRGRCCRTCTCVGFRLGRQTSRKSRTRQDLSVQDYPLRRERIRK